MYPASGSTGPSGFTQNVRLDRFWSVVMFPVARRAFTVVELLVVVIIMAVLIAA
jgi:prepilin-type N-terminal cleavage/methylation domain-containing protein